MSKIEIQPWKDPILYFFQQPKNLSVLSCLSTYPTGLRLEHIVSATSLTMGQARSLILKMEEKGILEVWMRLEGRWPDVFCKLSPLGLSRLKEYQNLLSLKLSGFQTLDNVVDNRHHD